MVCVRILVIAGLLSGCGALPLLPPLPLEPDAGGPVKPAATKVIARVEIKNEYAESLFTVIVTPTGQKPITLFSDQRIKASATAVSATFDLPLAGSELALDIVGTSLGTKQHFIGKATLGVGRETLVITYDYDLALADFRCQLATRAD